MDNVSGFPFRRVAVIVNPAAGRGRARGRAEAAALALRRAGAEVEILPAAAPGDPRRFAAESIGRFDLLAACGGDGTLAEVAAGLHSAALSGDAQEAARANPPPPAIAPLPCGTANVVARALGYPFDPAALARHWRSAPARAFDLGLLLAAGQPPRPFILCAGFGPDAEIVAALHARRRGSIRPAGYARPLWLAMRRRNRPRALVTVDGRQFPGADFGVAANFSLYAAVLRPCPEADPADGQLDYLGGRIGRRREWPALLWRLWRGRTWESAALRRARGRHFVWRAEADNAAPVPVQADGDPAGHLPAEIRLLPAAIQMPQA